MEEISEVPKLSINGQYRFLLFIISAILMAFCLVMVSMYMYNSSGAAQLDLSRPGYKSVRSQATTNSSDFQNYPTTGAIDVKAVNEFEGLYDKQVQKIKTANVFSGDPLSPEALGI